MKSETNVEENVISSSHKKGRGRPKISQLGRDEQLKIASQKYRSKNKTMINRIDSTLIMGINAAIRVLSDEAITSFKDSNLEALGILKYYLEQWNEDQ